MVRLVRVHSPSELGKKERKSTEEGDEMVGKKGEIEGFVI